MQPFIIYYLAGGDYTDNQESNETSADYEDNDSAEDDAIKETVDQDYAESEELSSEEVGEENTTAELAKQFEDAKNSHSFRKTPVYKKVRAIVRH